MAVSLVTVIFWDSFLDCDSLKVKKKAVHCTGLSICRFISPNQKAHFVLLGFHRFHSSLHLALFHSKASLLYELRAFSRPICSLFNSLFFLFFLLFPSSILNHYIVFDILLFFKIYFNAK
jgi:hypothetical protein